MPIPPVCPSHASFNVLYPPALFHINSVPVFLVHAPLPRSPTSGTVPSLLVPPPSHPRAPYLSLQPLVPTSKSRSRHLVSFAIETLSPPSVPYRGRRRLRRNTGHRHRHRTHRLIVYRSPPLSRRPASLHIHVHVPPVTTMPHYSRSSECSPGPHTLAPPSLHLFIRLTL